MMARRAWPLRRDPGWCENRHDHGTGRGRALIRPPSACCQTFRSRRQNDFADPLTPHPSAVTVILGRPVIACTYPEPLLLGSCSAICSLSKNRISSRTGTPVHLQPCRRLITSLLQRQG